MKDILTYHFIHSHNIRLTVEKARYSSKRNHIILILYSGQRAWPGCYIIINMINVIPTINKCLCFDVLMF